MHCSGTPNTHSNLDYREQIIGIWNDSKSKGESLDYDQIRKIWKRSRIGALADKDHAGIPVIHGQALNRLKKFVFRGKSFSGIACLVSVAAIGLGILNPWFFVLFIGAIIFFYQGLRNGLSAKELQENLQIAKETIRHVQNQIYYSPNHLERSRYLMSNLKRLYDYHLLTRTTLIVLRSAETNEWKNLPYMRSFRLGQCSEMAAEGFLYIDKNYPNKRVMRHFIKNGDHVLNSIGKPGAESELYFDSWSGMVCLKSEGRRYVKNLNGFKTGHEIDEYTGENVWMQRARLESLRADQLIVLEPNDDLIIKDS